jgi:peptidoglycan/LPS O-acetylase OafA/YrhL
VQHLQSHTALRGIAAMLVVCGHYSDVFGRNIAGNDLFLSRTYLGVDLFFLLSGFILFCVYKDWFAGQARIADWLRYMARRLARIYPLHLATLAAVIALMRFRFPAEDTGLLLQNIAMVHAWGFADHFVFNAPSWSISCEFAAYLLFPALMVLLRWPGGVTVLMIVSLAAYTVLWRLGAGSLDLDAIGRSHAILRVVAAFPVGMVLACWLVAVPKLSAPVQSCVQVGAVAALALGLAAGVADIVLMPPIALVVFTTADPQGVVSRALRASLLQWLGTLSYGIYLIQWPLMLLMFNLRPWMAPFLPGLWLDLAALGVFLILLLGLSWLSHRYFEQPFNRVARR